MSDKAQQLSEQLILAARTGNINGVNFLLEHGARVDHRDIIGVTSLMWAAAHNHPQVVKALLQAGADVNLRDKSGWTALIFATNNGNLEVIQLLIDAGTNINIQNDRGWTALMFATDNGRVKTVQMLLKSGAEIDIQDKLGQTAYDISMNVYPSEHIITSLSHRDYIRDLIRRYRIIRDSVKMLNGLRTDKSVYFSQIPKDLISLIENQINI